MRERVDMLLVLTVGLIVAAVDRVTGFISRGWEVE